MLRELPPTVLELRRIARFYLSTRHEANRTADLPSDDEEYRALSKTTLKFIEILKEAQEDDDIATDMYMTARTINPDHDKFGISDLSETQIKGRNDRHYRHLIGLLNLLAASVNIKLDFSKLSSGPRKNAALESLTQSASYFWSHNVGRKFSIDYHKGSGLTEAFQFVRALIDPLDANVSDQQIITAMRTEIKSRRARQKRLSKPRDKTTEE